MQGLVENEYVVSQHMKLLVEMIVIMVCRGLAGNQIFVPGNATVCAELFLIYPCLSVDMRTKW